MKSLWYADDSAAVGTFKNMTLFFERLRELGPAYRYFPEEIKSVSIIRNKDRERQIF